jgi:glycosyltransferase involved in cell wall biosynthesis
LPVVGSSLGAVGERIQASGGGWTVDPLDTYGVLTLLRRIRDGQEDWAARADAVRAWQRTTGAQATVAAMAAEYVTLYQDAIQRRRPLLPKAGRRVANLRTRVAVVVKGHFPNSLPTAHVRIGTAIGQASRESIDYDWIDAGELVTAGVRNYDGVIVCRNGDERPQMLSHLAQQCKKHQVPLVLDLDDDLLNVPEEKDPSGGYLLIRQPLTEMLNMASTMIASTEPLAEAYGPHTRSIRLSPNRLDPRVWMTPPEAEVEPPKGLDPDASLRVLYMGSPTHQEDLQLILAPFARLRTQHGVQLHTIGVVLNGKPPTGVAGILPPRARYDHFITWFRSISRFFDIAVAPLVDASFNRSKSDLKFLEYAACGLPVVASRVVPYTLTVRDGVDGLLADNDEESWYKAVESLVTRPELRASIGAAARKRAEEEFMARSCVFDELPWKEWAPPVPSVQASPANGSATQRRDVEFGVVFGA